MGYYKDNIGIKFIVLFYYILKVFRNLLLKINFISLVFYNLELLKIDNFNEWDILNIKNVE